MHVVAVDTNVFISTLLGKSFPYLITRELILKKKITYVASHEVILEYYRVISYNKFSSLRDDDDNKFLDLAYAANADFLITGNTKHFPSGKFEYTEIISPQKYWNTYWK